MADTPRPEVPSSLTADELATLAATTPARIQRLAEIGVLRPDTAGRFAPSDVQRVRIVVAYEVIERDGDYFRRTVNLASRLSGLAGPGEIVVDASTADAIDPASAIALGDIEVKGLPSPVPLYRVAP